MHLLPAFTRSRKSFLIGAALLTLLGLGLRLFRLANQSFWIDEIGAIMAAQGPLKGLYERSVLASNSLPTYFLLLKPFVGTGGIDLEFRARLLSVFAGALSVPVFISVIFFWRQKRGAALLAGTLLAVNPLHIWYSQEVRGYAMMLLFGLLTFLCFELARQKSRPLWWILYVLAALAAITTHKTGLVFPVACGLWHLWDAFKNREHRKTLLAHAPVAIAALAVLALKSYPPTENYTRSATGLEIGYTFLTFAGGYSFGPSVVDIQSHGPFAAIKLHPAQTAILILALLALALVFARHFRKLMPGREIQLILLGVGIVSLYALFSSFPYNVRYTLPALLGFLALLAVLPSAFEKTLLAQLLVAGFLTVAGVADCQWFFDAQYRKDDSRAVAQWLVQNKNRVHPWVILPEYMHTPVQWYLQPYPDILAREIPPTSDRSTTFPPVPDVLILTRRHHLLEPDKVVSSYEASAHGMDTIRTFTGFELYVGASKTNVAADVSPR